MILELKAPSPGESIAEVEIANWLVEDGAIVEKDQEIAEIESDKATLPLIAEEGGRITLKAEAGDTVQVGQVLCTIDIDAAGPVSDLARTNVPKAGMVAEKAPEPTVAAPKAETTTDYPNAKISPVAKKVMDEYQLSVDDIVNGLKRIGKKEVEEVANLPKEVATPSVIKAKAQNFALNLKGNASRETRTEKMSSLRRKLGERLVSVKNETAMLTTFNEVDMTEVMALRKKYQKRFVDTYGVKVGLNSFFIKAVSEALKLFPEVNAQINNDHVIFHDYADVGIAVQSKKGLIVPVIRNTESLSLAEIELKIKDFAVRGQKNKITLDEMMGGTFTISNGGTFGSLMSTPIINPPQSAILGMHNIVERPMAVNGKVEIRPMMYIALSYDHRIIDGKSSVGFLVAIKKFIENPYLLFFGGKSPEELLLEI